MILGKNRLRDCPSNTMNVFSFFFIYYADAAILVSNTLRVPKTSLQMCKYFACKRKKEMQSVPFLLSVAEFLEPYTVDIALWFRYLYENNYQ